MTDPVVAQPEIDAPRLRLRPLRRADAGLIALYCAHPDLARMTTSIPHPYPPGLAESFVERATSGRGDERVWALDTGEDAGNGLVGLMSLRARAGGEAGIGYWVAPAFWGAGYASEAVEAIAGHAAGEGVAALTAQAFQDNHASVKVLARAGFACEGEGALYSVARAAMVPTFRYRRKLGP
jgi:RimJ/RimL family protein N-acetyltransferase